MGQFMSGRVWEAPDPFEQVVGHGRGGARPARHDLARDNRLPEELTERLLAQARERGREFFSSGGSTLNADEWKAVAEWTAERTEDPLWWEAWQGAQQLLEPESRWRSAYEKACGDFDRAIEALPDLSIESRSSVRRYAQSSLAAWVLSGHISGPHLELIDLWQRFHDETL